MLVHQTSESLEMLRNNETFKNGCVLAGLLLCKREDKGLY